MSISPSSATRQIWRCRKPADLQPRNVFDRVSSASLKMAIRPASLAGGSGSSCGFSSGGVPERTPPPRVADLNGFPLYVPIADNPDKFVDRIGQHQHFYAACTKALKLRAALDDLQIIAVIGYIVFCPGRILSIYWSSDTSFVVCVERTAQFSKNIVCTVAVLVEAEIRAKIVPEFADFLRLLGRLLARVRSASCWVSCLAHSRDHRV